MDTGDCAYTTQENNESNNESKKYLVYGINFVAFKSYKINKKKRCLKF
jgi:hypothetical protein